MPALAIGIIQQLFLRHGKYYLNRSIQFVELAAESWVYLYSTGVVLAKSN
jgi:hypothetical protein